MIIKKYKWFGNVKEKIKKVCGMKDRVLKKSINNYIRYVHFLMLNGHKVDLSSIIKESIIERSCNTELVVNGLRNNEYFTPLMFAVTRENLDLVKEEIKKCDINKQDGKGYTALMYACRFNENSDIVKVLLDSGADIDVIASDGRKAFDFANDNGNNRIIFMLNNKITESKKDFDFVVEMANEYSKKVRFNEEIIKM